MSIKKRFEQSEPEKPEGPKKTSLLAKFSFKRKLEIEGVAREKLPVEKPISKTDPKSTVHQTLEVKAPVETQPVVDEPKIELESLAQESEITKQKKLTRAAQQKVVETQKKLEHIQRQQLEDARQRALRSTIRVFSNVIIALIFIVIFYQFRTFGRLAPQGTFSSFLLFFLVIIGAILGALFGREGLARDRWWNRWEDSWGDGRE